MSITADALQFERDIRELRLPGFFRLDLTVNALRRLHTNVVDVLTPDHRYLRAFDGPAGTIVVSVEQTGARKLRIAIDGGAGDEAEILLKMQRMLGLDCDLTPFNRVAARIPWLRALAIRMRGIKPPRYPTLWEAFVNAVVFQQLSLHAASAIVARMVVELQPAIVHQGSVLYSFPTAEHFLGANERALRSAGLSGSKAATLRRVADAISAGVLDERTLTGRSTSDCLTVLGGIKGIGPWTATVVLLRGLGRLDLFPLNDTSVAQNLALLPGAAPAALPQALARLHPQQGMLYYHLLLARLETRGALATSTPRPYEYR
jgi:DNA-3-methyladenine glycosylase II